jgi:carbonic anhydrase
MSSQNPHTIDSALQKLKNGNQRFVDNKPTFVHQDKALRDRLNTSGQTPMAAFLSCSDSRVPVEMVFDLGFGDAFVVRVAGNVPGVMAVASLEYAVDHLGVPLVVVLGHTNCGAVKAAVDHVVEPGSLGQLMAFIKPAVQAVEGLPEEERLNAAIKNNVNVSVALLTAQSTILAKAAEEGRAKIMGAVYQMETGQVIFN